jgi:hypothetical protein
MAEQGGRPCGSEHELVRGYISEQARRLAFGRPIVSVFKIVLYKIATT